MSVESFSGYYRFLSNFWVENDGMTVEHRFQAAKAAYANQADWVMESKSPGEAKRRGREVVMREDWDEIRIGVMEMLVWDKFQDSVLSAKLLETGDEELVEGNTWDDTFWGVCNRIGENNLGKILMKVRENL